MKILLVRYHDKENVNTRLPESLNRVQGVLPPLGIAYIASLLEKNGYKVKILDAIALNLTKEEFRQRLIEEKPDIVGITSMTANVRGGLEAASLAKESGAIVVIGGPQLAIYPEETLYFDFVDYGIVGEGEYSMLELVKALESRKDFKTIPGIAYKENGKVIIDGFSIVKELDELPFPARHLLPMEKYSSIIGLHPVATMISSRGCPYQCGFCFKQPTDIKYRTRSASNVVDEMEEVVKKYGVREVMFYDDTFTSKKSHAVGICEEILRRRLTVKWEAPTRVDRVDLDLLRLMRRAGCIRLRYGVESGDPNILRLANKKITLAQAEKAFKWTKKAGIQSFAYFIIGYLDETPETIKRTISFAKKLNPDLVMFTVATPYPKTALFEAAVKKGLVEENYWREFTLGLRNDRCPYLVGEAEEWVKRAYREFYLRPAFVVKKLLKVRSWDAFKKHLLAAEGLFFFKMKKVKKTPTFWEKPNTQF